MGNISGDNLYLHSKCHNAHWELLYNMLTKEWSLVCERCRAPLTGIILTGPQINGEHCAECGDAIVDKEKQ